MQKQILTAAMSVAVFLGLAAMAEDRLFVDVAVFNDDGDLIVPDNMDEWIFLGSSLGMGYSQVDFDPDSPGMFQIVRMEPTAYRAFRKTGQFVDGTMISLYFYGSQNEVSISRAGSVMDDLHFAEIHFKDSKRFPDGFNFYNVNNGDKVVQEISLPNECVECHKRDGAYDGVFVQFYPPIYDYLPEEIQKRLAARAQGDGH